jgi:hypothetical protein
VGSRSSDGHCSVTAAREGWAGVAVDQHHPLMPVGRVMQRSLVLLAACGLMACGGGDVQQSNGPVETSEPPGQVELQPMPAGPELPVPTEGLPDDVAGQPGSSPVTTEMYAAIDAVRAAAGNSPDFGGPEISSDGDRVVVRWYGDVPPAVQDVIDDYADAGVQVVVESTRFRPADLQAEANRLLQAHSGVIVGVGPRPAGDGLDVMIAPDAVERAGGLDQALAENGVVSEFPLFASKGSIVPA